jgi:hypothetical protein
MAQSPSPETRGPPAGEGLPDPARVFGEGPPDAALLFDLVPLLPENLLGEAIRVAGHVQNPMQRAGLLEALTERCQAADGEALGRIVTALPAIESEPWRAGTLVDLARRLVQAGYGPEALAVVRTIERDSVRATALAGLSRYLPGSLLGEGLATAREIADGQARARALGELAPNLPQSLGPEALAAAREIPEEVARARALGRLARHLPERLLPEALAAAREIDSEAARAKALAELTPHLTEWLLERALAAAQRIQQGVTRARALAAMAQRLPEAQQEAVLHEALAAVREIRWPWARAQALGRLASHRLPEPLLEETLVVAREIEEEPACAEALTLLARHLPTPLAEEALAEAGAIRVEPTPRLLELPSPDRVAEAWEIDEGWGRFRALKALAPHLSRLGPPALWLEALAAAREIENPWARARTLGGLAPHLPEPLLADALGLAREIETERSRAEALALLAPRLAESLLGEALAAAWEIRYEPHRWRALSGLTPFLTERLLEEELAEAWELPERTWEGESPRVHELGRLAPHLPEPLLAEALAATREIGDDEVRTAALAELAPHLSEPLLLEALTAAVQTPDHEVRLASLRALAPYLPGPLLEIAFVAAPKLREEVARKIEPPSRPKAPEGVPAERARRLLAEVPEGQQAALVQETVHTLRAGVADRAQARVVSTGFAPEAEAAAPLVPSMPLACAQPYYFWLEVGEPVAESMEETPTALPAEKLPPEARLKVALFALDPGIGIDPDADVGELQLLPDGSVQVAHQPADPPVVPAGSDLLARRLFFPVQVLDKEGVYHLRCSIYYEQILVQSRLVRARVMRQPRSLAGALQSTVDYTLSRTLRGDALARLAPHQVSLMARDNGDGSHGFHFFGADEFKSDAEFDGQELEDLIEQARGALRRAAWGVEGPWDGQDYRYAGPRDLGRLTGDLVRFAIRGYRFYDAIINRLAGGAAQAYRLEELMRAPGMVQIALRGSARFVLPAALIYDYGFDTNARFGDYDLCPDFLEALDGPAGLEACRCFEGACPSRGEETIICPSGFWGYRHNLGMPFSVAGGPDLPPEIAYGERPELAVGVSTDRAFTRRVGHERSLQALRPGVGWHYGATRDQVLGLLKGTEPHLVYFYCHGGMAGNVPYLQVGPRSERGITRDNLRFKRIRWEATRPLVFLNGCHTTALTPGVALEFLSAFVENTAASAVIGTEITIFEPLACTFAEAFLARFLAGVPVGRAVREARLALLKTGNPLGLVYIPFALASLRLQQLEAN